MALMINHHLLAVAFGILGNVISFLVFLAPVPTFYRIFKKKSTESFQCIPYLVALFSSMLWLYYALIKGDAFLLITINSFGCVIETVYIVMFLAYAPIDKRNSVLKIFISMNLGAFSLILVITHFVLKGNQQIVVVGWICVGFSVSVFAAPLSIMALVIKTKSVEFMPFTLSFFLTMSAIMWFFYGLLLRDICIALPNVLGFLLGLVQMVLYIFYKYARKVEKVADEIDIPELPAKNIVIFRAADNDETKEDAPEVVVVDIQAEEHRDQP